MAWIKMIVMEVSCSGDIRQIFRVNVDRKVDLTDGKASGSGPGDWVLAWVGVIP